MPWFKVSDTLGSKLETTRIPRARRTSAMGLWVLAGAWSSAQLTDGLIPAHMLDELCGTEDDARALVEAGFWSETGDGWQFIEWSADQPTKAEVLDSRAKGAKRLRDWRARNSVTNSVTNAGETQTPSRPVPTRPDPTTESPSGASFVEGGRGAPPPDYCPRHPGGTDRPCTACRRAREAREAWDRREAARPKPPQPHDHKWAVDGTCVRPGCDATRETPSIGKEAKEE